MKPKYRNYMELYHSTDRTFVKPFEILSYDKNKPLIIPEVHVTRGDYIIKLGGKVDLSWIRLSEFIKQNKFRSFPDSLAERINSLRIKSSSITVYNNQIVEELFFYLNPNLIFNNQYHLLFITNSIGNGKCVPYILDNTIDTSVVVNNHISAIYGNHINTFIFDFHQDQDNHYTNDVINPDDCIPKYFLFGAYSTFEELLDALNLINNITLNIITIEEYIELSHTLHGIKPDSNYLNTIELDENKTDALLKEE